MEKKQIEEMIDLAIRQLDYSYVPYSHFHVGAALLAKNGTYYTGCNIENAAYTPTNCAERTAFFKAVSEGVREFQAICIVGGKDGVLTEYAAPCGVCRQVMMEFCDPETFQIILAVSKDKYDIFTLKELLPLGFGPAESGLTERNVLMETYKRVFVIVLDSLGIGAMPDSEKFGDKGVDTFGHILDKMGTLDIPNLQKLGMLNLHKGGRMEGVEKPMGRYMRIAETSNGKDTMTGHWEMMGINTKKPFITFTETGFPKELIQELEKRCGKRVIGNKSASGTEIIEELGEEEINTGAMIVYTSADSVMQICGNEETFDLANLYRCCEIARELTMKDEWRVGRVIARPYVGKKKGEFKRTSNRHDYALKPTGRTALNALKDAGLDVIGVGKINDIFCGEGITKTYHSDSSVHGMQQTVEICKEDFHGLCFVNLVDFDALWGHRRNPEGYGHEIEKFDKGLGNLMNEMREDDLLILTADHGNDPTYTGTDHTREYVPFLAYSKKMKETGAIDDQDTFAVIGASVAENFGVKMPEGTIGKSILEKLK